MAPSVTGYSGLVASLPLADLQALVTYSELAGEQRTATLVQVYRDRENDCPRVLRVGL